MATKTDHAKANEVAKFVHDQIGTIIHKIMTADDKPVGDFEVLLASFAGQLAAISSSVKVLSGAGFLTEPLAKNLDAAVVGISAQLSQSMRQSLDEHFEKDGHCGLKGCEACDRREAKRVAALH